MSDCEIPIADVNALEAEIERLRAAYDDAVSRQKARRNAIIEECARVAEQNWSGVDAARAIRALKDKP